MLSIARIYIKLTCRCILVTLKIKSFFIVSQIGSRASQGRPSEGRSSNRGSALTRSISKSILSRSVTEKKKEEMEYKHPAVATINEEEDEVPNRTKLDNAAFRFTFLEF